MAVARKSNRLTRFGVVRAVDWDIHWAGPLLSFRQWSPRGV